MRIYASLEIILHSIVEWEIIRNPQWDSMPISFLNCLVIISLHFHLIQNINRKGKVTKNLNILKPFLYSNEKINENCSYDTNKIKTSIFFSAELKILQFPTLSGNISCFQTSNSIALFPWRHRDQAEEASFVPPLPVLISVAPNELLRYPGHIWHIFWTWNIKFSFDFIILIVEGKLLHSN